jgi:xanthine dehydrogenase accessory factor
MRDFHDTVTALRRGRQPFATATVVGRRPPVSAHLGDRALIHADGRMEGFIGGACSREIVRKQALDAIRTRRARLVSIRPDARDAGPADPEHVIVAMTCVSEGAVDVYVEPSVLPRRLIVVGTTPVAEALARLAPGIDYEVVRVVLADERADLEPDAAALGVTVAPLDDLERLLKEAGPDAAAVVASQGHYDEEALETILKAGARYVGLVASRKRGATVKQYLADAGIGGVETVRNPAGIDLGARSAPEVALSILAEIVQMSPAAASGFCGGEAREARPGAIPDQVRLKADTTDQLATGQSATTSQSATAVDPICQMEVEIAGARHTAQFEGTTYYFCCAQCRTTFLKAPASYLTSRT